MMANKRAPLVLTRQHFGSIVFDRRTSRYLPFDHEATDVLLRLKEDAFDAVRASAATDAEARGLEAFFSRFHRLGFFTLEGRFAGDILPLSIRPDHLVGPLAVHLEIVAACNLKCAHCFAGPLPRRGGSPLSLVEIDNLFSDMADLGSFRLGLTGGEPTLRKDLFEILDLATSHGLHPCLTTNGLLITEAMAREFGKRELVWLNVSLDGATPQTNDMVRGKGTFDTILEQVRMLRSHTQFTLAFTVMKHNAGEARQFAELARELGASTAVLRPLYPVGTAQSHLDELMPEYADYAAAVDAVADLAASQGALRVVDPFGPMSRQPVQAITYANHGCGAANTVCSISVTGDVNPCSFLGANFVAGNIRERSLGEIWSASEGFRSMRSLAGGGADEFSGGCRARALAFGGAINRPDPWIQLEPQPSIAPMEIVEVDLSFSPQ